MAVHRARMARANLRLNRLVATLHAHPTASEQFGAFDKHGDNHLRVPELFAVAGKVALVTGGSIGIGRMIAEGLAVNGCKVYITSRKMDACEECAKELNALAQAHGGEVIPFASNLSEAAGCQAAADFIASREGCLHILVNNAGATWGGSFDDYPDNAWPRVFDLNVRGVFNLTQRLAKLLTAAGTLGDPARVINIASVAALKPQSDDNPVAAWAYSASKAAVAHMSVGLAKALGKRNISTNVICPGLFITKMNAHIARDEKVEKGIAKLNPLSRNGEPGDMAGPALFLCSKAGAYINGAVIPVDGGMTVG